MPRVKWWWPRHTTVEAWVTLACLASHFMLPQGYFLICCYYCYKETFSCTVTRNFFMSDLTINPNSVMFYALLFLEANHNRGQLELLCIDCHNKLRPETSLETDILLSRKRPCMWVTDILVGKLGHDVPPQLNNLGTG